MLFIYFHHFIIFNLNRFNLQRVRIEWWVCLHVRSQHSSSARAVTSTHRDRLQNVRWTHKVSACSYTRCLCTLWFDLCSVDPFWARYDLWAHYDCSSSPHSLHSIMQHRQFDGRANSTNRASALTPAACVNCNCEWLEFTIYNFSNFVVFLDVIFIFVKWTIHFNKYINIGSSMENIYVFLYYAKCVWNIEFCVPKSQWWVGNRHDGLEFWIRGNVNKMKLFELLWFVFLASFNCF